MIVVASQALWALSEVRPGELVELCRLADRPCHVLLTDPIWDEFDPHQAISRWLAAHRGPDGAPSPIASDVTRMLLDGPTRLMHLDRGGADPPEMGPARTDVPVLRVRPGPPSWSDGGMPLDVALRFLSMPLQIMVEGKVNDGAFLKHMALPGHRRALKQALDERWAELGNAGGIDGIVGQLAVAGNAGDEANWRARLRTWYMFDRDAHKTDMTRPSEKSDEVVSRLS